MNVYSASKFVQLLNAHWWRRQLTGQCDVVAVSPGLIPGTGLGRYSGMKLTMDMADAKPVTTGAFVLLVTSQVQRGKARVGKLTVMIGAQSILAAFTRSDFPSDPDRIFLTSWGEWWEKDVIEKSLDKELQDKWSWSKEEIEKEAGIAA